MKIISKYKDYYDYLQGIYGVDEKLVLDRRGSKTLFNPERSKCTFHIGEYTIDGLWWDNKLYLGKEIEPFVEKNPAPWKYSKYNRDEYYLINISEFKNRYDYVDIRKEVTYLGDKSPTWKEDCPLLYSMYGKDKYEQYPLLSGFDIHKVLTAEQVWLILSEWLSKRITKNEPEVPVGDDKVRIQSAGFDLKTSFRKL